MSTLLMALREEDGIAMALLQRFHSILCAYNDKIEIKKRRYSKQKHYPRYEKIQDCQEARIRRRRRPVLPANRLQCI